MKKSLVIILVLILISLCSCKTQGPENFSSATLTNTPMSSADEKLESTQKDTNTSVSSTVDNTENTKNVSNTLSENSSSVVSLTVAPTNEKPIDFTLAFSNVDNNVSKVIKKVFLVTDYEDYLTKLNKYFLVINNGKTGYEEYALDKKYSAEFFDDKALILCDFAYSGGPVEVDIKSVVKNSDSKKLIVLYNDKTGIPEGDGTFRVNMEPTSYKSIIEISAEDAKDISEIKIRK